METCLNESKYLSVNEAFGQLGHNKLGHNELMFADCKLWAPQGWICYLFGGCSIVHYLGQCVLN